jgi:hypothetical protein
MVPPRELCPDFVGTAVWTAVASVPALLLFWWWIRGVRRDAFEFPYFRADRRRWPAEFWFWLVIGLLCGLVLAAIPVWVVAAAGRGTCIVLAAGTG